jgi:hypothetical protein
MKHPICHPCYGLTLGRLSEFFLAIVVGFVAAGCNSHTREIEMFQREIKKAVDPIVLQTWAAAVVKTNELGHQLSRSDLPGSVRLMNGPTSSDISTFADMKGKAVFLNWGSGFGHWGIIVGDTNFTVESVSTLRLAVWRPGIYFYAESK